MNIHTVLNKISGYLDAYIEYAELTHDELDALCKVEDALHDYVKEKEDIIMNSQKYFVCKHCGKVYIIENGTVIEEDAQ